VTAAVSAPEPARFGHLPATSRTSDAAPSELRSHELRQVTAGARAARAVAPSSRPAPPRADHDRVVGECHQREVCGVGLDDLLHRRLGDLRTLAMTIGTRSSDRTPSMMRCSASPDTVVRAGTKIVEPVERTLHPGSRALAT
jgi:hypothetical protein